MDDAPPPRINLEAVDPSRNIRRRYDIEWGQDLLGDWLVETRWGRVGARGQARTEVHRSQGEAARSVRRHLRRRATASRRIGVAYTDCASAIAQTPVTAPVQWTTRLRNYRWVDGFDGWVEDDDAAILAVHPARGQTSDRALLDHVRQSRTTHAWGLYADGRHLVGRNLFISEWWATETIRLKLAQT